MDASDLVGLFTGWIDRLRRVARTMIDLHLDLASKEAEQEKSRLAKGLFLIALGIGLVGLAILMLQLALVSFAHGRGLTWLQALLAVGLGDLVISAVLFAAGSSTLKGPWMDETRARLTKSAATLRGEDRA